MSSFIKLKKKKIMFYVFILVVMIREVIVMIIP